jgi:hypothetical protein
MDEKQATNDRRVWVPTEREIRASVVALWLHVAAINVIAAIFLPEGLWLTVGLGVWIVIGSQRYMRVTMREPDEGD